MTFLAPHVQMNDHSRAGASTLRRCGHSSAHAEPNNLSGQALLLPGREYAGLCLPLARVNSRTCSATSALRPGSFFIFRNALTQLRWQALADVTRFHVHLNPLRRLAGFDAHQPSERVIHEVGNFIRVLGQIIRGGND